MAITILQQPSSFSSAHDDVWWNVYSTNSSIAGYKFVCDIYVASIQVARLKAFPNPSSLKAQFNVANVLRNYIAKYFRPVAGVLAIDTHDIYVEYTIKFGEEYGGTLYTNVATATSRVFNYAVDYLPTYQSAWVDAQTYEADYDAGGNLLTRSPYQISVPNIGYPSSYFISNMIAMYSPVEYTLSARALNNGVWTSWVTGPAIPDCSTLGVFNVAPSYINTYLGTSLINTTTTQYEVDIAEDIPGSIATIQANVLCTDKYQPITLHFLNSLGGYDSFVFGLVNRQSRTNESKSFETLEWELNPITTNTMDRYDPYGVFYGGMKTFANQQTITFKLISDYVTLQQYYWLNDLIRSTEVYMGVGADRYMPVTLKTTQWTEKKRYTDKVYNLEVDIEVSAKTISQYK